MTYLSSEARKELLTKIRSVTALPLPQIRELLSGFQIDGGYTTFYGMRNRNQRVKMQEVLLRSQLVDHDYQLRGKARERAQAKQQELIKKAQLELRTGPPNWRLAHFALEECWNLEQKLEDKVYWLTPESKRICKQLAKLGITVQDFYRLQR